MIDMLGEMKPTDNLATDQPAFAREIAELNPVSGQIRRLARIPASRMFLIKKSLKTFQESHPDRPVYDASQGDGGASLPGVLPAILERAAAIQLEQGTAYTGPAGTGAFRQAIVETYWKLDAGSGIGPENVVATAGGRDALLKAYVAMMALGYGRSGDALVVSRVPWISYTWGSYGIGANALLAPGKPEDGWVLTPEAIDECVAYAADYDRKIAGLIITSPDNPTGQSLTTDHQAALAHKALEAGAAFVLFDWMYQRVTDQQPVDLNHFLSLFEAKDRARLIFLDGLTKSLGGSNIRNAHLIVSAELAEHISALASHGVIPPLYSQAVALAALEYGFEKASRPIVEPTNASRAVVRAVLSRSEIPFRLGQGYYAFLDMGRWLDLKGWKDTEPMGAYLATEFGLATVPGVFFSPFGGRWIRFSYALPPEITRLALERLQEALDHLAQTN